MDQQHTSRAQGRWHGRHPRPVTPDPQLQAQGKRDHRAQKGQVIKTSQLQDFVYIIFVYSRLLYQSRKRGMLENGLLLSTFAARYLQNFDAQQVKLYDELINQPTNDWDIFYWATKVKPTPDEYNNEIMDLLKKHVGNEKREQRLRQPGLYEKL